MDDVFLARSIESLGGDLHLGFCLADVACLNCFPNLAKLRSQCRLDGFVTVSSYFRLTQSLLGTLGIWHGLFGENLRAGE